MHPEDINWEIEHLRKRFDLEQLDITYEQAEKIYEQEKSIGSIVHSFSVWEKLDYQLSYLQGVLDANQLQQFINQEKESIKGFEQSLIKQDQDYLNRLEVAEAQLAYYSEKLLPAIFSNYTFILPSFDSIKSKITYLKASYQNYLDSRKKEIYISHFRNSRNFQPNTLKLALIHHQLACLFPAYNLFKEHMDEPTKAVKNYLVEKLWPYSCSIDEKLKTVLQELRDFSNETAREEIGERRGWHSALQQSEKQEQESRLMYLVLLDKDKYGY